MFLFGPDIRQRLRRHIAQSAGANGLAGTILARAEAMLGEGAIASTYEVGRPVLLPTTRRFADRTQHLVVAWLLTGEARFARHMVDDLMAAINLPDWNRRHFLDVAEMVSVVTMARQWIGAFLSAEQKNAVDTAIVDLGLIPGDESLRGGSEWTRKAGNWNIVCNSALILAAVALRDRFPQICGTVLAHAQASLALGMQAVGPSGEWFEGLTYWSLAAHHAALAQMAVDQAGYGLENPALFHPILDGGTFVAASVAPSGLAANFGDALTVPELCPMQGWLSTRSGRRLPKELVGAHPFALIWGADSVPEAVPQAVFMGNHLAVLRQSAAQAWLAVSVGTADHSHAHHDLGSFIWETGGVRFVVDPGRLDYAVTGYFSSDRFGHFGATTAAHNLPVFDAASRLEWRAKVEHCRETAAAIEMVVRGASPAGTSGFVRRFQLLADGALLIEDRISPVQTVDRLMPREWQFHTDARVETGDDGLFLHKMGRRVQVLALAPDRVLWELQPLDSKSLGLVDAGALTRVSFRLPDTSTSPAAVVQFHASDPD